MALSAGYLRKPQDVTAKTKDGAVGRIPEKATGRHGSDKRWRCRHSAGLRVGQMGRGGQDHWRITLDEFRTCTVHKKGKNLKEKEKNTITI